MDEVEAPGCIGNDRPPTTGFGWDSAGEDVIGSRSSTHSFIDAQDISFRSQKDGLLFFVQKLDFESPICLSPVIPDSHGYVASCWKFYNWKVLRTIKRQ